MVPIALDAESTMDSTAQANSIDWTSIINNTVNQVPSWIALAHNQPVPYTGTGYQGGSLTVTPYGIGGTISPGLVLAGVVAIVGVIYLLTR